MTINGAFRRVLGFCLALPVTLLGGQLQGPPAGVPVPPAPIASDNAAAGVATSPGHFRLRVLDGQTGMPVENATILLWYDEPGDSAYSLRTDAKGVALMPDPAGVPVRVLVRSEGRTDCRPSLAAGEPPLGYNLQQIAERGIAVENRCGRVPSRARRGELVLFVRKPRWYEGLNR